VYAKYGTKSYNEGLKLFKLLNPDIKNMDLIYPGQTIKIPDPSIRKEPWYSSIFDISGNIVSQEGLDDSVYPDPKIPDIFVQREREDIPAATYSEAASILNAKLINKGIYYFPRRGARDFELNLSHVPLLELNGGLRVLLAEKEKISATDLETMKVFWDDIHVVSISPDASVGQVLGSIFETIGQDTSFKKISFSDGGIRVEVRAKWINAEYSATGRIARHVCISPIKDIQARTPDSIVRYLEKHNIIMKDISPGYKAGGKRSQKARARAPIAPVTSIGFSKPKVFVNDLLTAMGFKYAQNVGISFPYAGIQVETVSNLISKPTGGQLLVDFGDLYGDAVEAIQKTGLAIVQIQEQDSLQTIIRKLFSALGITYSMDPTFLTAKRTPSRNISLSIPGYLASASDGGGTTFLLSIVPLHDEILRYLQDQDLKIILIGLAAA
jgi:hypothetical protein